MNGHRLPDGTRTSEHRHSVSGVRSSIVQRNQGKKKPQSVVLANRVPGHVLALFALACLYVVIPIVDIPLMGVSLSAPIFYLIIVEIALGRSGLGFWPIGRWKNNLIVLAFGLLASYLVSTILNTDSPISWSDGLLLLRYFYWVVVFVVSTLVVAQLGSPARLVRILGWAVIGLAVVWFWDRFDLPGAMGVLLTPNSYGFVFSTFWSFAFVLPLLPGNRVPASLGLAILGIVVVLNGSRGSWVAILAASAVFVVLLGRHRALSFSAALAPLAAAVLLVSAISVSPEGLTSQASRKISLSSDLGADKSWAIRKVMVKKGWQLFQERPVFGVGAGRFNKTMTELELPSLLRYGSQETFNKRSAHNSYVAVLAETGLAGSLPFFVLLGNLARRSFDSTRWLMARREQWSVAVVSSLVGMSVHMWVIAALTGTHVWLVYGLVAGVIAWQQRMRGSLEAAQVRPDSGAGMR